MDPVEALERMGGVADASRLLTRITRKQLRTAVDRGRIVRLRRGTYGLTDADAAVVRAGRLGGKCSHLSAAALHGWELAYQPDRPWITVPRSQRVDRRMGCHVFWADLSDELGWITGYGRTVLDCARRLDRPEALAIADSALRHRDVEVEDLRRRADLLRGKGSTKAREIVQLASPLAANPFESVLRSLALSAGLDVEPQAEILPGEITFHPDLVDVGRSLVLEADSWEWHAGHQEHERDVERYTALTVAGWRVLRFGFQEVMYRQADVLATLMRAARTW